MPRASAPRELAETIAAMGSSPPSADAVDKVLGVAAVRARHRVGAVDNLQSWNTHRSLNKFLVRRDEPLHCRKALFRVVRRGEIAVLVLEISLKQQPGLRIEVGAALGH